MSRLPTPGGDPNSWGTVLNDYLTKTAGVAALATSPIVGATTFDLAVVPPGLVVNSTVLIDAFTTEAELRTVTNVSGNTVTVAATKYAHASGDAVLLLIEKAVTPPMYGIAGGTTDNWGPFQRMVSETNGLSVKLQHVNALKGFVWEVSNPICVVTGSQWQDIGLKTHSSYGPVDAAGALCMVSNREFAFTAAASTNVFTVAAGHGMGGSGGYSEVNHTKIVFNAPYGETLPGGITAGKVYYIDTTPSGTTFTVSATDGGATLDVTSDGAGTAWESIEELARVYWDNVRFDVTKADVSGVRVSMQQPAYMRNVRMQMDATATAVDTVYGLSVIGQIGYIDNLEINTAAKVTAAQISGTGIVVRGFNCNGVNSDDTGLVLNGWGTTIYDPWTEQCGTTGIHLSGGRDINICGNWVHAGGTGPALTVAEDFIQYTVCPIHFTSGSDREIVTDTDRGFTLRTTGATDEHIIASDYYFTFPGWFQQGSQNGTSDPMPPIFNARRKTTVSTSTYKIRYHDYEIAVNTTGGTRTLSLPPAAGWAYHSWLIQNAAGANTCTIDTTGSETIDGAASITVPAGQSVMIQSDGTNYRTISRFIPSGTIQTYTATNVTTDRSYDADTVVVAELADVVGTLIADLRDRKIIA